MVNYNLKEIIEESFKDAVEIEKKKILSRKWYHKLFPFTITIKRRQ